MSLLTFERNLLLKNKVNFLFPLLLVVLFAFPLFFDHKLAYTEFDELNHNYEEMQRLIETLKEDENEKEFVESLEKSNKLIEAILHAKNTGNVQQMVEATYHYEKDILDRLISGQRQGIPIIEQQKRVELLRYMKEHQIQRYSIFDLPAHLPLANYYENIFSGMISSFLILCITALFLSSIISYEKRKQVISLVNLLGTLLCLFLAEYRLFSSIGWIESISHYLPTSYVDFQNVIIGGDIFSPLASEQVTFMNGILTLGTWSIVLLFIGMGTIYIKKSY